ncbi:GAF and ANTAR domain-containing protein [Clavibacter nebraskensis]|uniref:GAF and ANTAR domain-containing protein n=1 Tax=Clavibacter nebraskensis TaxID=31963 RepID=UPI0012FAFE50|nr:GAF and ANTAR domain-containing protein [Clavibacter nebraskensis]QGV67747.1 GAF and ANTAR domain-containing protein [Clavibacter nebraskensis]
MPETREALLVHTFVTLADSLVSGYDVLDLLQTLVDQATLLFDASASGIIIGPDAQHLEVVASTSEKSRLVGLMQLEAGEGPCVEAVSTGRVVSVSDVREIADRWPAFAAEAQGAGYVSVHAIPLRLRGQIIGSLNLFREHEGALNEADATAAQALADVATISVLQERTIRDSSVVHDQLRHALDSRVLIEQAKGVISRTLGVDMDEAFRLIRREARSTSTAMPAVAAEIVEGRVTLRASAR